LCELIVKDDMRYACLCPAHRAQDKVLGANAGSAAHVRDDLSVLIAQVTDGPHASAFNVHDVQDGGGMRQDVRIIIAATDREEQLAAGAKDQAARVVRVDAAQAEAVNAGGGGAQIPHGARARLLAVTQPE
jgi:hypothetical protein